MTKRILLTGVVVALAFATACKHRKSMEKTAGAGTEDTSKCHIGFKTARSLGRHVRENEFKFKWVYAKANVESHSGDKDENFDIKVRIRRDSVMLVSIQYLLGVEVAKALITRDSVKFVNYIQKNYFVGDFNYINDVLNADLDFDLLQAVLFGNSAEFQDDEAKLKPATDKQNCVYHLSTERKRKLRKIQAGADEPKSAMQTLTLKPDYKIIRNEFIDPVSNRTFIANYSNFTQKDSVFAPYHVDIELVAQKKTTLKIDYVRIEKNTPQKVSLNIPAKYDPIQVRQK